MNNSPRKITEEHARIIAKIAIGTIAEFRWGELEEGMRNGNFTEVVNTYLDIVRSDFNSDAPEFASTSLFDEVADQYIRKWMKKLSRQDSTSNQDVTGVKSLPPTPMPEKSLGLFNYEPVLEDITKRLKENPEAFEAAYRQYRELKAASDPFTPNKRHG